ncbi:MAG: hypothetical protein ACLQNE_34035, partial [Thermoguttaceae bacterium]
GDPGTRPPGRGPRFAHHAAGLSIGRGHGDTFTTRPGCRSVWTAAGTAGVGGDPGTRPLVHYGAAAHHAAGCRSVWTRAGLSIGRGHGRRWRRSWNTSTGRGPRFAHPAAGLSIGRGHGDTFTTGRAVDRCGRPRARPEILEHVHPVEALALLP